MTRLLLAIALVVTLAPASALACACGCGVFGVGTSTLIPSAAEVQAFGEWDYMDQDQNWSGSARAPAAANPDQDIRTDFWTAGVQAMVGRHFGVTAELPFWDRRFTTIGDSGAPETFHDRALGDVRVMGMLTTTDRASGLLLGLKLPTGDWRAPGFDRDTEIGSGTTDLLLGLYHSGPITADGRLGWFAQGLFQVPLAARAGYRPGRELDAAAGLSWQALKIGKVQVSPVLQVLGSLRARDAGPEANPEASGYRRLLVSPGITFSLGRWRLYGDVELPAAQSFNGEQLAAPALFKVIVSKDF